MLVRNIKSYATFSPEKMGKASLANASVIYSGLNCFLPGQAHQPHTHEGQDKLYYVLAGVGMATVGREAYDVAEGDLVLAPGGIEHSMKNTGAENLIVLTILAPPPNSGK
jgi:quercetin dioxygenase-like cupin family protein